LAIQDLHHRFEFVVHEGVEELSGVRFLFKEEGEVVVLEVVHFDCGPIH
jgi:hypothetical protein